MAVDYATENLYLLEHLSQRFQIAPNEIDGVAQSNSNFIMALNLKSFPDYNYVLIKDPLEAYLKKLLNSQNPQVEYFCFGREPDPGDRNLLAVLDRSYLEANCGKFILSVANGRGEVTRGGTGEMKLDVRGLAPLYTNLFTPQQLQRSGYLQATSIATATALFTNSSPWMPDFF